MADEVAVVAASRLLGVPADALADFAERWREPEYPLDYREAAQLLRVPESTLRSRVNQGRRYVEGRHYVRTGPRSVRFSRRILEDR